MSTNNPRWVAVALVAMLCGTAAIPAHAERRQAPTRVNKPAQRGGAGRPVTRDVKVNQNLNVNQNVNVNRNIDVDRDIDVDVDVDHNHGCCWGAAAVTTAAVVTAATVGTVVYTLPASCTTVVVGGFAYRQCGTVWYHQRRPQQPGANLLLGMFYAESLILAETGASTGAIQIAGTDEMIQIPFFVASCDYTLIGEELYASSAYLSPEAPLLGTLKAQDYGKAVVMAILVIGTVAASLGFSWFTNLFVIRY